MKKLVAMIFCYVTIAGFSQDDVKVLIGDVGAGLGTVTMLPNGKVMVYDAGRYTRLIPTIKDLVPVGGHIDLLILSHNDSDHIGGVQEIDNMYTVGTVVYSEYRDTTIGDFHDTYNDAMEAISNMRSKGTNVISVTNSSPARTTLLYNADGVKVTYLCGFGDPMSIWEFKKKDIPAKPRNAISLVVRLDYEASSIIYGGDAVGKLKNSEDCVYTERYLLDSLDAKLLDADIIISPHHGADNGDCDAFIKAVTPQYVIFSAGSEHGHPRESTVNRYLNNGVKKENMFRTDRGDHEKKYGKVEWREGRVEGCEDMAGDDDIEITLSPNKKITVKYVYPGRCYCKDLKEDH